ncbi:hypothetical protein [Polaribacter porphyrae]|uniref:hypothetical protein n=1 Tax=Polaribacter porphyrae TaxID=1137780 RepID=UPI0014726CE1|nr:hypothetical protein [Polaribacter porphyrae]
MVSILMTLYALLNLNTAQIEAVESKKNIDKEELSRLYETGDDIRVEIQSIRSNF